MANKTEAIKLYRGKKNEQKHLEKYILLLEANCAAT